MAETSTNKSALLDDVDIKGSLTFKGDLSFDGKLSGGTIKGQALVLGPNARVDANIQTDFLTVLGKLSGEVAVAGKCHLQASAQFTGNLKTARLVVDDGATLIGTTQIGPR
jgi:cytoskeletal protein CcmA (bactofilin family)